MRMRVFPVLLFLLLFSCSPLKKNNADAHAGADIRQPEDNGAASNGAANSDTFRLSTVMSNAALPLALYGNIMTAAFMNDLLNCRAEDRHLWELVDKQRPLPPGYDPLDLVTLENGAYQVSRAGMTLRRIAADSLSEMAAAARADGITLVVSSAYRSYAYQEGLYQRYVQEMGQEATDRVSARPGHSQHQTGLVVDFGSIDNSFAQSAAGRWVRANAARFGWSLSYPEGYEAVTGYSWESWHYRYVGEKIAAFIDDYFDGIQQYALRFLYEWEQ